jgi:hypothetical protein
MIRFLRELIDYRLCRAVGPGHQSWGQQPLRGIHCLVPGSLFLIESKGATGHPQDERRRPNCAFSLQALDGACTPRLVLAGSPIYCPNARPFWSYPESFIREESLFPATPVQIDL